MKRNVLHQGVVRPILPDLDPEPNVDFNVKLISTQLQEVVNLMALHPAKAIKYLRAILATEKDEDKSLRQWINGWTDRRGFDLLHNAIINEKTTIIKYLLSDAQLFQPSHAPKTNPYAHMTATLGFRDCLQMVLTYRPNDYFVATEPSHAVKLPYEILTRLKLGFATGMNNRRLDKIVQAVKFETKNAEMRLSKMSRLFEKMSEKEIHDYDGRKDKRHSKCALKYHGALTLPSIAPGLHGPSGKEAAEKSSLQRMIAIRDNDSSSLEKFGQKLQRREKKDRDGGKITVHMKVFDDDSLDRKTARQSLADTKPSITTAANNKQTVSPIESPRHAQLPMNTGRAGSSRAGSKAYKKMYSNPNNQRFSSLMSKPEIGIRKFKKYKDFVPVFETRPAPIEDPKNYMDKSPLTIAAEKNHLDCVFFLLHKFHPQRGRGQEKGEQENGLTLAANARIPEAIAIILQKNVALSDYQDAVLLSIRKLFPDSLNVLLTLGGKMRQAAFGKESLFHILYTQSLQHDYRYEMLPEMTRVLINSNENVNFRSAPREYPLYTLIQSAFNVSHGEHSFCFLECLKMLLDAKANPHYDEIEKNNFSRKDRSNQQLSLQRQPFSSAIHCVLHYANASFERFKIRYWFQIVMQSFIDTIETHDKYPRRIHPDFLFVYMRYVCRLGLNRRVIRSLLRYGADPDVAIDGRFAINVYFEEIWDYMARYKLPAKVHLTSNTLTTLLMLCRAMKPSCLTQCVIHFLDNHLLTTPLQGLELIKKFCYYANQMIISPRSLRHLTSRQVWVMCQRNPKNVRNLPVSEDFVHLILP